MPRTSEMLKSKYINKAEVRAAGAMVLTIIGVTLETMGTDQKWVLWFQEHPKGLNLNNTKIKLLEASYGEDSDGWNGRKVRLTFDATVQMQGQLVGGIRLECSNRAPPPAVYPARPVYAANGAANGGGPAHQQGAASIAAPGTPPAPPQPVWDGTRWVLPESPNEERRAIAAAADAAARPTAASQPLTLAQRANAAYPPDQSWDNAQGSPAGAVPPGADPDFNDPIPF